MLVAIAGGSAAVAQADEAPASDLRAAALLAGDEPDSLIARVAMHSPERALRPSTPQVEALSGRLDRPESVTLGDTRASNELAGVSYRLWMSRGRAAVGVGLGALGRVVPSAESAAGTAAGEPAGTAQTLADAAPVVSVAMRYRTGEHSSVFADASLAHAFAGDQGVGDYANAKVGVEWKAARPRLGFEHGRLGVQLDSGYRMSFRIRKSGVGVYLRGNF